MNKKFIYCTDEEIAKDLENKTNLVINKIINGKNTWIFENNNKINFSKDTDINEIEFTNKFYL